MKKRGGQKKHWADVVKVKIWCETLKSQSGLSDYELNKRFAWKPPYKPSSSLDRTWVFEWIRKEGREPQGRDVRWRSMSEIITAVDQVPEFSGIRSVYDSGFWELLKLESISLSDVRAKIQTKLKFHSLKRVDKKYDSDLREAIKQYDEQSKVY